MAALARGRLLDQLDAVLRSTVTLVRTPAGFGKTTLLRQWHDAALAWWVSAVSQLPAPQSERS